MRVVCNAGPLIALGKLGQLGLLQKLFTEVLIANEVFREVVINGRQLGAREADAVDFFVKQGIIQLVEVEIAPDHPLLVSGIDLGEIATLILGKRIQADWVLIDDMAARRIARRERVPVKGTMGLLLAALQRGFITLQELELLVQQIKSLPELWISDALCEAVLRQARQTSPQR